jgi:arylsulfatase A-like enzyme
VTFRVTAQADGKAREIVFEEAYADREQWGQRSVDLSGLAGGTVTLGLEVESSREGTVAFWAAPIVSGARSTAKPNIIFYIIDGAGADYMSVYGYNRRTTPNLERLAIEGAIFERAYSNSSWTRPSTPSFLTSLQHSVLGGLKNSMNRVPDQVLTIAEHLHQASYQTAEFTSNPNAGRMSNLERGVDVFREAGVENDSESSVELHENFWRWRDAYPSEPYWVHFQTTDVHAQHNPPAPFAGLYISHERQQILEEWERRLGEVTGVPGTGVWGGIFEQTGIDRVAYMSGMRDMYDEDMAHQDHQIGQLVARLKAAGEWERTLLIIASDHGAAAGSQDWDILMRDDVPPAYDFTHRGTPIFRSGVSRIPLIVVWPGHIVPGQRFSHPVSMIDMLPTILDLADLPMPEVMQGQSLAPLLLGEGGWEPRPVIFDEFEVDRDTGELGGRIEVIDGRWGASLEINPKKQDDGEEPVPGDRRPATLLLYDLWNDPSCLNSLHDERPDLVERYTAFLEAQWEAHQALAGQFTRSEDSPLTPEQLETLRSLGYIQ